MTVECPSCGWRLEVPPGITEGREFACGHCGQLLRNDEEVRAFRWVEHDPFARRFGSSRVWYVAGLLAGFAWIPALAVSLLLRKRFDPAFLAAVGVPWLALEAWLARRRAGIPAARWYVHLWIGIGAFVVYVALLVGFVPTWRALLGLGESFEALKLIFVLGVLATMVGVAGASLNGWVLRRTPTASATPPAPIDGARR